MSLEGLSDLRFEIVLDSIQDHFNAEHRDPDAEITTKKLKNYADR